MNSFMPEWLQPALLEAWPTQLIQTTDLHYALSLRQGWVLQPVQLPSVVDREHVFRGQFLSEWLTINFMDEANAQSDLREWVEAFLRLTGFPSWPIAQACPSPPFLLEWHDEGSCPPLAQRLSVDETYLYQGLAALPNHPSELARLYILLARRGTHAWKITLSLLSACPPGTPAEIIQSNDHVRAGATFGTLELQ